MDNKGKVFYMISKDETDYRGPVEEYLSFTAKTLKDFSDLKNKEILA